MFKLLHLTDVHLALPGEMIFGYNVYDRLDKALAHMARKHSDADKLVITGDLSHWGDLGSYQALADRLNKVAFDTQLIIGNHDYRPHFQQVFEDRYPSTNGFVQRYEDTAIGRFIYLDSNQEGTHAGHLCEQRLAFLDGALAGCEIAFLFLHHNPCPVHEPARDSIGLIQHRELATRLKASPGKVRHIFFGHRHMPLSGSIAGTSFPSVRSTNTQGILDMTATDLPGRIAEPQYGVVMIDADTIVCHVEDYLYAGPEMRGSSAIYRPFAEQRLERGVPALMRDET